jgi:hypothetical protein
MARNLLLTTGAPEPTCGCTTIYYTVTGAPTRKNLVTYKVETY